MIVGQALTLRVLPAGATEDAKGIGVTAKSDGTTKRSSDQMKTTFDKAERVAARLSRRLGTPDWFLGVGIESDLREGFVTSVRVQHGHSQDAALPDRIDGVKVRVVERGIARSLLR